MASISGTAKDIAAESLEAVDLARSDRAAASWSPELHEYSMLV